MNVAGRLRLRAPRSILDAAGMLLSLGVFAYLSGLGFWLLQRQLVGDATWWLFSVNSLAIYLFVPLPLALLIALLRRNLPLIGGVFAAGGVFLVLWGGLFLPHSRPEPEGPVLRVMTYNLLGFNPNTEGVIKALRESDADIIGLLELNPEIAAAIERDLGAEYPYRLVEPEVGVRGAGVISRLPFRRLDVDLDDPRWISQPAVLQVDFNGTPVLFVRAHSSSGYLEVGPRERQARLLSDFAASVDLPVIIAGDFNASDLNDSHAILTEHLYDAWREAGSGLGNTFPGVSREDTPQSSRPDPFGIDVPKWLIRIDYIFCSYDWQPIDARIGPWDGYSDHRPVIAELALRDGAEYGF